MLTVDDLHSILLWKISIDYSIRIWHTSLYPYTISMEYSYGRFIKFNISICLTFFICMENLNGIVVWKICKAYSYNKLFSVYIYTNLPYKFKCTAYLSLVLLTLYKIML